MKTYSIGDKVWIAQVRQHTYFVECLVCAGKRHVTLILGDGEHVSIACGHCTCGLESTGKCRRYRFDATPEQVTVTRVEQRVDGLSYNAGSGYSLSAEQLFDTEDAAAARCVELRAELTEKDLTDFLRGKEHHKQSNSYAWHVGYHRTNAKKDRQSAEWHEAKAVALQPLAKKGAAA